MKIKIKPMASWIVWAGGLSLVMGIVTREQLLKGFQADTTGMSAVIAGVFGAGLIISFMAALQLQSEWQVLKRVCETGNIPPARRDTDLAAVFGKLAALKEKGETADIYAAVETYHSKHNSRARSVSILAALVISMGLLGTVIGLIMSISGLGGMVENIGLSRATMMEALKTTVAGMGTAFYTTFFGALGGLILRAVAVSQLNSLSELCAEATEYAATHLTARFESKEDELNKKVSQVIASFDGMQQEIEAITARLAESFDDAMRNFGDSLSRAGEHAMSATRESINGMTGQMEAFGSELGESFGSFNESIEKAGEEVHGAFGGLSQQLTAESEEVVESFNCLTDAVNESTEVVSESLADLKIGLDGSSQELQGAVGKLHSAIREAMGEIKTMSQARLNAEASEIAGHLSLAASTIQQFVSSNTQAEENQKVA